MFVKTAAGTTLTICIRAARTVNELRERIAAKSGGCKGDTWLGYDGRRVYGLRTLAEEGVRSGTTIWEHGRGRGGTSSGSIPSDLRGASAAAAPRPYASGLGADSGRRFGGGPLGRTTAPGTRASPGAATEADPWWVGGDPWGGSPRPQPAAGTGSAASGTAIPAGPRAVGPAAVPAELA